MSSDKNPNTEGGQNVENKKNSNKVSKDTQESAVIERPQIKRQKQQSNWNLKKCMKVAKRFENEDDWANGAPSSYKAACANGWKNQCLKNMISENRRIGQYRKSA